MIVISHFHNDHIQGILETIKCCKNARVYMSSALTQKEFIHYIFEYQGDEKAKKATEFINLFKFLRETKFDINYVVADTCLYRNKNISIEALSPCSQDIKDSQENFAKHTLKSGSNPDTLFALPAGKPNHYCVVLRVYDSLINTAHDILLGADLEIKAGRGWDSVCKAVCAPKAKNVAIFKIPHHGSETGYHQATWDSIISNQPISILTTFDTCSLPREDMVEKYKSLSRALYCTANPKIAKKCIDNSKVKKVLASLKTSVRSNGAISRFGAVIIKNPFSSPDVYLHGDAVQLK